MSTQHSPRFVFYAHHKCASSWINRFLWHVTLVMGVKHFSFHSDEQAGGDIIQESRRMGLEAITVRNARWDHWQGFKGVPGVHLIRDPRDVIVSGYFSHLKSHRLLDDPELAAERKMLERMSREEGLIASMDGINGRTVRDLGAWRYGEAEGVLELRLEEVSSDSESALRGILEHAGWLGEDTRGATVATGGIWRWLHRVWRHIGQRGPLYRRFDQISESEFQRVCGLVSFERLSGGRQRGETDIRSHYRRGVHGDWVNHFSPEVESAFKKAFPGLVSGLGYEKDESWSAREERFDALRSG